MRGCCNVVDVWKIYCKELMNANNEREAGVEVTIALGQQVALISKTSQKGNQQDEKCIVGLDSNA